MHRSKRSVRLHAFVSRGDNAGKLLFPHEHEDGEFVVSKTRFERDYIRVANADEILGWLEQGYGLRMSNPDAGVPGPSLIKPASIYRPVLP